MPELPEVENVCRSLRPRVEGVRCRAVRVRRADVVTGDRHPKALLAGQRIESVRRQGKQIALVGEAGTVVCVHLGMTGSLVVDARRSGRTRSPHDHVAWSLDCDRQLVFRDPRRFGGIWTFPDIDALTAARWSDLGPDALVIRPRDLHQRLAGTRRALKAALLDQTLIAGLGNIYVDELLFRCGLAPTRPTWTLSPAQVRRLVAAMRRLLHRAIDCGGSTVRDYVDGHGVCGRFQLQHHVYGRGEQPCTRCGQALARTQVAGRTTVFCRACQVN